MLSSQHSPRPLLLLGGAQQTPAYILEELLRHDAGARVDRQLHLTDLLVDLLHEVDHKVHQLVFVHLLCVEVGDQKTDVIPLGEEETGEN